MKEMGMAFHVAHVLAYYRARGRLGSTLWYERMLRLAIASAASACLAPSAPVAESPRGG